MSQNTSEELILTLVSKDFDKFKEFLESLKLSSESADILDQWFYEGAWNIETDEGEKLLVFFGKEKIHVVLKKNKKYEQLQTRFLKYFQF